MNTNLLSKEPLCDYSKDHQFNGIDIVKFVYVFLICIIHFREFQDVLINPQIDFWLKNCLCRVAVPFYFTASGFLLFRKIEFNNLDGSRIKSYCFKLLRLLGTWGLLLFVGKDFQLWYLGALIVATIILSVFIKKGVAMRWLVLLSLVLFFIGLLGDSYYELIIPLKSLPIPRLLMDGFEAVFHTTRNGIFFGLVFVLMGALFAKKRIVISNLYAFVGLFVSLIMLFLEVYLLRHYSDPKDYNMLLSLLPVTFFTFYLASHIELNNHPIYKTLRSIGTIIFFIHLLVGHFVCLAIIDINSKTSINLTNFSFLITVIITVILAVVIEKLSKNDKFHWLKYLYS